MSYAASANAFSTGVQELSFDEINEVAGGPIWVVPIVVAVIAAGAAVIVGNQSDDCTTTTTVVTSGNTVTTTTRTVCT